MTQGTYKRCHVHGCRKGVAPGQHVCLSHLSRRVKKQLKRTPVESDHQRIDDHIRDVVFTILRDEGLI